jgi:putative protein kinase ArgK-like GTPase of G3E family
VETVGRGQSKPRSFYGPISFLPAAQIAGAGRRIAGIKRGIMEKLAMELLINKCDGNNIEKAIGKNTASRMAFFQLFPPLNRDGNLKC